VQCKNVPRTSVSCYIMRAHTEIQIFIKNKLWESNKNIALKTNAVTNIVHRYCFHTYNTRLGKKFIFFVTSSPGLPFCNLQACK
jgi:hypothetical protein